MTENSGFFLSHNGDRRYAPAWLAEYIKALVSTGVYAEELAVTAGGGMTVDLAAGRAWVEGYLYRLDGTKTFQVEMAHAALHRRDALVVRLDLTDRTITAQLLSGTPASSPVAPDIVRNADTYDLKLAEIYVAAGTTSITQEMILDCRLDDTVCGLTVCPVQHISTVAFLEQMTADFNTWFQAVRDALTQDAAGNLYTMIRALSYTFPFSAGDWTVGENECTITIPAITHQLNGTVIACQAFSLQDGAYLQGTWAARETWAELGDGGAVVLHYPGTAGYAGRAVLSAYSEAP